MSDKPKEPARPTDAELEILTVLWSLGPTTVREVHETVNRRKSAQNKTQNKAPSSTQYTTVLKTMQIMAEKGLVKRNEKQRAHVYEPSRSREWTQKQIAGDLLQRAFGGSARSLMLGALSAKKASRADLAEIRRVIDEYEKGAK
jgi:predicted transcriptional regulator